MFIMPTSLTPVDELFAAQQALNEAVLEQLWQQWRMIGSGATTRSTNPSVPTVVDPEALMLVSLLHSSQEPRLGDLIVNWATHNVDLLSVQRIRNLLQTYPSDVHEVLTSRLAWFAEIAVTEGADPRWRPLMKPAQERDAVPLRAGRHRAVRAPVTAPSCLALALRLGLGVGAKADIMAFLLGTQQAHAVRDMAHAVGYTVSASRRSVEELTEAGWLELRHGQPAYYRAHWSRWSGLLGLNTQESPRWEYWHQRFVVATAFSLFCEQLERACASSSPAPSAIAIEMRTLLEQHRTELGQRHAASWGAHERVHDWVTFGGEVVRRMALLVHPDTRQSAMEGT